MAQQSETQNKGGGAGWFVAAVVAATVGLTYLGATSEHATIGGSSDEAEPTSSTTGPLIHREARIDESYAAVEQAVGLIRAQGWDCHQVRFMSPHFTQRGFDVTCRARHGALYDYEVIDDHGTWIARKD
jgi:hypothetical protein